MSQDHLNNELSLAAELTPSGVKASAKSRLLSAVDRLAGGVIDIWNASVENVANRQRARGRIDVQLIEAAGRLRLEQLHEDPEIAAAIWNQHLKKIGRRAENKASVITFALEDLRQSPPTDEQTSTGPESLDETFLDRFERYVEDATTEQLRERWGRILSAEIRAPGVFSGKVLRVVDELDSKTAHIFETFCRNRLGDAVPRCLAELTYTNELLLVSAELLTDPGLGQMKTSVVGTLSGAEVQVIRFSRYAVTVPKQVSVPPNFDSELPLTGSDGSVAASVYLLTETGEALASILENNESKALLDFAEKVAQQIPGHQVRAFDINPGSSKEIGSFQVPSPVSGR